MHTQLTEEREIFIGNLLCMEKQIHTTQKWTAETNLPRFSQPESTNIHERNGLREHGSGRSKRHTLSQRVHRIENMQASVNHGNGQQNRVEQTEEHELELRYMGEGRRPTWAMGSVGRGGCRRRRH